MRFTGKERDAESGLDYFLARYYSGAQGRYTSPDWSETPQPVPYADFGDPQTLNLYSYVRNNPLSLTDPDGHCPWGLGAFIGGVGGGVASYVSHRWTNPNQPVNWKQVGAGIIGGAVTGGTLGLATAPGALITLEGTTVMATGTAVRVGAASGTGMLGGVVTRAVESGGDPNAAMGTLDQIATDAVVGAVTEGVNVKVVEPGVRAITTAGRAVSVGEAKIDRGVRPSPSLPQRQQQLRTQQQVAGGAAGAAADAANRAREAAQRRKKE